MTYKSDTDLRANDDHDTVRLLRSTNIQAGSIVVDDVHRVDKQVMPASQYLKSGDFAICIANGSRALVGKAAKFASSDNYQYVVGAFCARFRPHPHVNPWLIEGVFESEAYRHWTDRLLVGTNINNLKPDTIASCPISIPKTELDRNRAGGLIASVSNAIQTTESLIAAKREQKRGLMQELLTGRRRFPGFGGDWKQCRLGDIATIGTGSRDNQDKVVDGKFPFFVRSATIERIDSFSYDTEAVLVPGEGGIGSIFHYINGKFEAHQRVYVIRDFATSVNPRFVYYAMRSGFRKQAVRNSVKAAVDSLRLPTFKSFSFPCPEDRHEQDAIANTLDYLDTELTHLESLAAQLREQKRGLMQRLFSGDLDLSKLNAIAEEVSA